MKEHKYNLSIKMDHKNIYWQEYYLLVEMLDEHSSIDYDELGEILKNKDNKHKNSRDELYTYFSEVGHYQLLTAKEEQLLGEAVQQGSIDAFKCIVLGNLRLVIVIAQRYEGQGLEMADLISEGNLGLMHATYKYDPQKGCRFSTYAVWWIKHYIEKAIMNQGRTVRLPIHINKALKKLMGELHLLSKELERSPTVNELSMKTGQSIYEVMELLAYQKAYFSLDEGIAHITASSSNLESYRSEQNHTIDFLIENETYALLEKILLELEPNERAVIEYRFGVDGQSARTLDKTGEALGLTRDQVRYLQTKTLEKIRTILEEHGVSLSDVLD